MSDQIKKTISISVKDDSNAGLSGIDNKFKNLGKNAESVARSISDANSKSFKEIEDAAARLYTRLSKEAESFSKDFKKQFDFKRLELDKIKIADRANYNDTRNLQREIFENRKRSILESNIPEDKRKEQIRDAYGEYKSDLKTVSEDYKKDSLINKLLGNKLSQEAKEKSIQNSSSSGNGGGAAGVIGRSAIKFTLNKWTMILKKCRKIK